MIKSIILITSFLTHFQHVSGQDIAIKVEKSKSPVIENFHFRIINSLNQNLFYSVALEMWNDEGGWSGLRSDVFNYSASKKTQVFNISGGEAAKRYFNPKKLIHRSSNNLKYRLRVKYGSKISNMDLLVYSESFVFY